MKAHNGLGRLRAKHWNAEILNQIIQDIRRQFLTNERSHRVNAVSDSPEERLNDRIQIRIRDFAGLLEQTSEVLLELGCNFRVASHYRSYKARRFACATQSAPGTTIMD